MSADPLASIGKGIVQVNLRLNRVLELLERPSVPASSEEREILFELLDALERALERPAPRAGWWSRFVGRVPATDAGLGRGIEVAHARALARLQHLGITRIDTSGSFDAELHEALERMPAAPGVVDGTIARTHRTGFVMGEGAERRVLRSAQVSVYSGVSAIGASNHEGTR
jgi:molecular chaperone GrpE (heat shock protein)